MKQYDHMVPIKSEERPICPKCGMCLHCFNGPIYFCENCGLDFIKGYHKLYQITEEVEK